MNLKKIIITILCAVVLTGCGQTTEKKIPVQSVLKLAGLTDAMQHQQFIGVVSTGKEQKIERTTQKIAKVNVQEGDIVEKGDILFTYDEQDARDKIETEKLQLEIEIANLESERKALEDLQLEKAKASADRQMDYSLAIKEQELSIREKEFKNNQKETEIKKMEEEVGNVDVKAPISGRITKVGKIEQSEDDTSSDEDGFIKIEEVDNYRIKGTINEQSRNALNEGDRVWIYSRLDDSRWEGTVSTIDYKTQQKNDTEATETTEENTSSKYNFYVSLEDLNGLIIGQHVYIRVAGEENPGIRLSASFIDDDCIWVEKDGRLKKQKITKSDYNEEEDTYRIEGLEEDDYIAYPSSKLTEGMPCIRNITNFGNEDDTDENASDVYGGDTYDEVTPDAYEGDAYDEVAPDEYDYSEEFDTYGDDGDGNFEDEEY